MLKLNYLGLKDANFSGRLNTFVGQEGGKLN